MLKSICASSLLLLSASLFAGSAASEEAQVHLTASAKHHQVDPAILAALEKHSDPVDALVSLYPEAAEQLAQPRLLHVLGEPSAQWMTEGDKLRLKRQGKKFTDITDHEDFYKEQVHALAGEAHLPKLSHQRLVKSLFPRVSTKKMSDVLEHMTGYYTRYFGSVTGEESSQWLHDHIAEIIKNAPFHSHISLEVFTHSFPQSSIIARFEPKVRNFSLPLTILGAHQDSMNYLFPLLPAPGADDDCSGTVSILEAFRVLAESGFIPSNGPVEFHWYAAEEGGLLGSQAVARYKKESGARIGAMMEFDMTAFIAKNATESIGFIETEADAPLTSWAAALAEEYISIPANIYRLPSGAGSDYMSYTQLGYPAAFASEGNPSAGEADAGQVGEFDPYIHTEKDTMHIDDDTGIFSLDHMARFSELAIAFVVEQAGWDNKWRASRIRLILTDKINSITTAAMIMAMRLSFLALSIAGVAAAAPYTGGDISGCGKSHWFNGITQNRSIQSSGVDRSYGIHVPSNYSENQQYPTILGFHGSDSIGLFFEVDTGFDSEQFTGDKIMVYPNGLGGAWAGANYSEATVEQDLQFVWDMLVDLRQNFCIDSARIYATGMSIGAGFVDTIACNATVGGEFAAFAPASGSFYTDNDANYQACEPARVPVPILEFHGGADTDVPYNGGEGEGGIEPSIPNWLSRWAQRNQCDEQYQQEDLFDNDVHHLSWTCNGQEGVIQHYKTDDQKHDWASPEINFSQIAAGDLPTHISATTLAIDFFMNFTRPAA